VVKKPANPYFTKAKRLPPSGKKVVNLPLSDKKWLEDTALQVAEGFEDLLSIDQQIEAQATIRECLQSLEEHHSSVSLWWHPTLEKVREVIAWDYGRDYPIWEW